MSVVEKKIGLQKYCGSIDCSECKLNPKNCNVDWKVSIGSFNCINIEESDEEDLNKALALIAENLVERVKSLKDDPVNHPSHYTDGKIEVIDFIEDKKLGFCLGNAVKYICRAGKKDTTKEVQDLEKAIRYVNRRIKQLREAK